MNKAVFLDRDGVINDIIYELDGKLMSPATLEQLHILPHVREGLAALNKKGYLLFIITNQPGLSMGYICPDALIKINNYLLEDLSIDGIYVCPHHPKNDGECDCRKPNPNLILKASRDHDIDLKQSYMIGDNLSDIACGQAAGVKECIRIGGARADIMELQHKTNIHPDATLPHLLAVSSYVYSIFLISLVIDLMSLI